VTSGRHLLDVISSVLDFAKSEAGQMVLRGVPVDLREIVTACVSMVQQQCSRGGLALRWTLPAEPVAITGDPAKLRQILLNLLSNAMKFTPPGGEVRVTLARDPQECPLLSVSDSGIGMSPDDIPIALAPFGQIDSGLGRSQEGTGLGLPLTKVFADLHNASLEIVSQLGHGTSVSLRFDAEASLQQSAERPSPGSMPAREPALSVTPIRVPETGLNHPTTPPRNHAPHIAEHHSAWPSAV
jgi:signal transduction histidine kinase